MPEADRYCTVVSTPTFDAQAKGILDEDDRRELETMLAEAPHRGVTIARTGGFRKVRFARPSRGEGKRGGVRVVYYFVDRRERVYLVLVYAKNQKEDLTSEEEKGLRRLARMIEGES